MDVLIFGTLIIFFSFGASLYFKPEVPTKIRRRVWRTRADSLIRKLSGIIAGKETEELLAQAGFPLPGACYQALRGLILLPWFMLLLHQRLTQGGAEHNAALLWLFLFIVSMPRRRILGIKSPISLFCRWNQKRLRQKYNKEIYRCFSQLKNLAVSRAKEGMSGDAMLLEMARYTRYTKPIFNRAIAYWVEARYEDALDYLKNTLDTQDGEALAGVLGRLEYLKLPELLNQIELYQKGAEERRKTASRSAREFKANLLFALVLSTGMVLLINFLIITIAIDALDFYRNFSF